MLVDLLASAGKRSEAITVAERSIRSGTASPTVSAMYVQLQTEQGMDSIKIVQSLRALKADGQKLVSARLAKDLMQANAIDGEITTLDGKPLKLSDWKGKVVFIDYWATWCGPCIKSFPALQKLYERYKDNPNVVIAAVNVWERSKDRVTTVRDFLGKNKYISFPIYMDATDAVVSKYGVTGIPSKFILGKDGRIQFKEVGMMPEEQFLEETTNKIELLLSL
jgi:thiol-disulfide isomerase/thioredoxin